MPIHPSLTPQAYLHTRVLLHTLHYVLYAKLKTGWIIWAHRNLPISPRTVTAGLKTLGINALKLLPEVKP